MKYDGNFRKSLIMTESQAKELTSTVTVKTKVVLDRNDDVDFIAEKGTKVEAGNPLIVFSSPCGYEQNNSSTDMQQTTFASEHTGIIDDIKIYYNVQDEKLSKSVAYIIDHYKDDNNHTPDLADYVLIEFYITFPIKMTMGEKIIGRKGTFENVQSLSESKKKSPNTLYGILNSWKMECDYAGIIQFKYRYSTGILCIFTARPGILIGKQGYLVNKYTKILKDEIPQFKSVKFEETDPFILY